MVKKGFKRIKEDFSCVNCRLFVKGSGYTNHCPRCLFSLHVDNDFPGDRASNCKGIMHPIGVEKKKGNYMIVHECKKCRKVMKNKVSASDNFEELIKLSVLRH